MAVTTEMLEMLLSPLTQDVAYRFDPATGAYIEKVLLQIDPAYSPEKDGSAQTYFHKEFICLNKPQNYKKREIPVLVDKSNPLNSLWEIVPDFRGLSYRSADGTIAVCSEIGPLPEGASFGKPPALPQGETQLVRAVQGG